MSPASGWLPLTAAQRGIYFAHQLDPTSSAYSTAEVVEIDGDLQADLLEGALAGAYQEYEQLRVAFRDNADGPEQAIFPRPAFGLRVVDLESATDPAADAAARIDSDLAVPLDLAGGETVRTVLFRLGPGRWWWYHCAHHVVMDGFGFAQFARRVARRYTAAAEGQPPPPVAVAGLREVVREEADRAAAADGSLAGFWAARLPAMAASTSLAGRTDDAAPRSLRVAVDLPGAVQADLVEAAARHGAAWTDIATAAMASYLSRMIGAPEVRLGVPLMNRTAPGIGALAAARTVCTAMNVLPVPASVDSGTTVAGLVAAVRADLGQVQQHAFARQEDLARSLRRLGDGQLFGPQVNLMPFDLALRFGQATGTVRNISAGPVEDMTWCLRGVPGAAGSARPVRFEVDANPRLYALDEVRDHAARLLHWLSAFAAAAPGDAVAALPLLSPAERQRVLVDLNDTARPLQPSTLWSAFQDQAGRTPAAAALRFEGREWTYARLSAAAHQVAGRLTDSGVRAGDVVGVALPRGFALFAAIYGALAAGAAYLPLDPALPRQRVEGMLADAGARVVVAESESESESGPGRAVVLPSGLGRDGPGLPAVGPGLDDVAYVLFTSGSTGRPKGVRVSHRAIDNRLQWMQDRFPIGVGDRVLHKTPITFDVSVWELFWPLQVGATVVIAEPGGHQDPRYLSRLITADLVSVLHFVPSMLRAFLADRPSVAGLAGSAVRHVVCSGEALPPDLVRGCAAAFGVAPTNLYGPTEAAVDVTWWDCDPADDGASVPIGRPVWNTRCYVLGPDLEPVPVGAAGELYLAGVQVALGYAGRDELTAERFQPDPFVAGERMYRTGDQARWRSDGALMYLGRGDGQVKIRGQRLELAEVEAVLLAAPGVRDCAVLAAPDARGDARLVAYLTGEADAAALVSISRQHAMGLLPDYMIPARFEVLPALPLSGSGKTDRSALAALPLADDGALQDRALQDGAMQGGAMAEGAPPVTLAEQRIAQLMGECLGLGRALRSGEDFFLAGGHSLLALTLIGAIERELGLTMRLADVFAGPTPRALAVRIAAQTTWSAPGADLEPLLALRPSGVSAPGAPLFLLPPAGGLSWCYLPLLRHLPPDVALYAVQGEGMDGRAVELPATLAELAQQQLAIIRSVVGAGPFHLLGWSIGGMAAHAVAAAAAAEGQRVGVVAMLDACPAEQWRHLDAPTTSEALRGVLRMAAAEHLVGADEALDHDRTIAALTAAAHPMAGLPPEVLAASIHSVVNGAALIRRGEHARLEQDVLFVRAAAPRAEDWLSPDAWRPHIGGRIEVLDLDATHPDLVREPAIAAIAAQLADALARHDLLPAGPAG